MERARAGRVPHAWPGALVTSAARGGVFFGGEEESRENEVIWNFSENWWKLAGRPSKEMKLYEVNENIITVSLQRGKWGGEVNLVVVS